MPGGTALFGCSASRSSSKNLVEFKAGKMTMKGKMVHPDKRKGLVYIYQSEDSLMHFCWKDRNTGSVEDDLIIFPDDVEFKRVPQCTTGRVYILKFKSSSRKFFFWIQEPKTDKDEDNCRKVNEVLNNPPSLGSQRSGGATPDGDLQNLLSNMSQQQLMQLFGGVGQIGGLSSLLGTMSQSSPRSGGSSNSSSSAAAVSSTPSVGNTSTTTTTTPAASSQQTTPSTPKTPSTPANSGVPAATPQAPAKPTSNPIQLRQLQTYLSGLGMQASGQGSSTPPTGVDLSTSLTAEGLQAVLNNPEFVREVQRHLPPVSANGSSQQDLLRSTLASPQFQQAVSMFSTALQSGQLGPVMSQFDVGPDAVSAANQGNMEEFVRALQAASISVQQQQQQQQQQQPQPPQQQEGQNTSVQGSDGGTATGDSAQRSTTEASSDNKDKKEEEEEMNLD